MDTKLLADTYNCSDSTNSAYGAGNYGSCSGTTSTTEMSAPNTGFLQMTTSGTANLAVIIPLAVMLIITLIGVILVGRKKRAKHH